MSVKIISLYIIKIKLYYRRKKIKIKLFYFISFVITIATWIDAVDLGKEGQWMWFSSGKTAAYLPWFSGEPNNHNSVEHCAVIFNNGNEKWNDTKCHYSFYFMCEKKIYQSTNCNRENFILFKIPRVIE